MLLVILLSPPVFAQAAAEAFLNPKKKAKAKGKAKAKSSATAKAKKWKSEGLAYQPFVRELGSHILGFGSCWETT